MLRFRQFMAVAMLAAVESARQPICLLLLTACVLASALCPILLIYHFGEEGKMARDGGLAFHFLFGLCLSVYAAHASLARELRSGTAAAVLSKPVGRSAFFLAKFAGMATIILLFSLCATASTLLSERVSEKFGLGSEFIGYVTDWRTGHMLLAAPCLAFLCAALLNYTGRRPFSSSAFGLVVAAVLATLLIAGLFDRSGAWAPFDLRVDWRIVPASLLITMALLTVGAIALSLSTRLGSLPALAICGGLLLLGLASDYCFGRNAPQSVTCALLYRLIPNWHHFWIADALNKGGAVPWEYVWRCAVYGALYSAGILTLGVVAFRHTELK
jgi:ABC-type transport system involved in multi-copper enzyme maturation permease subunit